MGQNKRPRLSYEQNGSSGRASSETSIQSRPQLTRACQYYYYYLLSNLSPSKCLVLSDKNRC